MRRLRRAHERHIKEQAKWRKKFKKQAIAAGTAAVITLGAGVGINKLLAAYTPDPHELPVSQDADADLLADFEELHSYVCLDPQNRDQNLNGIPDGVELAKHCAEIINQLPWDYEVTDPNQTYKWVLPVLGVEACDICGQMIHMGDGGIVNPRLGISVDCHPISVHYMEHGSFSYAGEVHSGRIDVPMLLRALEVSYLPYEPNDHQLPVPEDADADLLSNKEEFAIGYQPFNDDQNKNEIPDGIELAKRCCAIVAELPSYLIGQVPQDINETYKIEQSTWGLERCHICGQWIHMGGWEIINPKLNLRYPDPNDPLEDAFLPDLALHYMQHGSFDCYGDEHQGRVNLQRLMRVLELRFPFDPNDHQLPLDYVVEPVGQLAPDANDLDADLLADSEELKSGFDLYDSDQDNNLILDGIELAKQCAVAIGQLPTSIPPDPNKPYKILYMTDGLETCEICGLTIPMDHWTIFNPRLGLMINVPVMAAHYMEHGSFSYFGHSPHPPYEPVHAGRVNIALLAKILEMPQQCGDLGTLYLPGDLNKDCKVDSTDFAKFADKWLQSTDPNQD